MKTALSLRLSDGAKRNGAKIILLLSTVLWGSSYFILKDTLDEVPPYFLLSFRFLVAAVLKKHIYPLLLQVTEDSPYYAAVRSIIKFLNYFQEADVEDEIPPTSILREFIGGNTFYR